MNDYRIVDLKNWERAVHCAVFRDYIEPCFCVTFDVDITGFYRRIKREKLPFTFAMIYTVARCANGVKEFRYRFYDGDVVLFEKADTAFTYLNRDAGLFKVVRVPFSGDIREYCECARSAAENQIDYFTGPMGNDIFQFSPMPWITYRHISHTISGKKDAATPLFDWGKYYEAGGKMLLPFSVRVHHSFVDGLHVGMFADLLREALE